MISQRLYCLISTVMNFYRRIGAVSLSFDMNLLQVKNHISTPSKLNLVWRINYGMQLLLEFLYIVILITRFYYDDTMDQFHISWVCWLGNTIILTLISVTFWLSQELCQNTNGVIGLLRFVESNVLIFLKIKPK